MVEFSGIITLRSNDIIENKGMGVQLIKKRPETHLNFDQFTNEIIMYKCQISKNSRDGINASQFKATLISC